MNNIGPLKKLRFLQIRFFSKWLEKLSAIPQSRLLLQTLGRNPYIAHALVGFRRSFGSFAEAERCMRQYKVLSHEHPANVTLHMLYFSEAARVSDYPVLFYMQRILGETRTILDIGGSGGNLFYCYSRYLAYPENVRWTVFEIPENVHRGRQIAAERGEPRLLFIDTLDQCKEADIVIISGSLHYFEALPPELIRSLARRPQHLFINRTPVIDGPSTVTIQDAGSYYAVSPARILSRSTLLESMAEAGFDLVDDWVIPELRLRLPLNPASSATAYSGFYFRSRQTPKPSVPLAAYPRSARSVNQRPSGEQRARS